MDTLRHDIRHALRALRGQRSFTLLAIVCLALGIGVNATVYSLVDAALFRPLPYHEPERIVALREVSTTDPMPRWGIQSSTFAEWRRASTAFSAMGAMRTDMFNFAADAGTDRVQGTYVSPALFPLLGTAPALGRGFRAEEERPGAEKVVILSDAAWRFRFDARADVLGRTVLVDGAPRVVVGVMPPHFSLKDRDDFWLPLEATLDPAATSEQVEVWARLAPGVTLDEAASQLRQISARLAAADPAGHRNLSGAAVSLRDDFNGPDAAPIMFVLLGAVSFVLLVACANVANLFLARGIAREREVAVRAALGASRWRIVRQLLVESVMVGLAGGVVGALITYWGLDVVVAGLPQPPAWMHFEVNLRVLLYVLAVSVGTGVVFGLVPALRATRPALQGTLSAGGRGAGVGARRRRLSNALVVGEVSLSLVLLVGASLMVRSVAALRTADPRLDIAHLLTMRVSLRGEHYATAEERSRYVAQALERLRGVPGVVGASAVSQFPLADAPLVGVATPGSAPDEPASPHLVNVRDVGAGFFRAMNIPLQQGRELTEQEVATGAPVAVVSRSFVERELAGQEPVGARFRVAGDSTAPWITVVGVAADVAERHGDRKPKAQLYLPYGAGAPVELGLVVRTQGDPHQVAGVARDVVQSIDRAASVFGVQTFAEQRASRDWLTVFFGKAFGTFATIALVLASVGLYGILAYFVGQRRHEIGVRMALGARAADVRGLVIRQGFAVGAVGVAIGLVGAFGLTRVLRAVVASQVSAVDPVGFVGIPLALMGVVLLASYLPARRATAVDPMAALRQE